MSWIYALDLIGTLVFAISGVLTAIDKKFDLVGSLIIGFVTAIGGGSLRDIMIGNTPVSWLRDTNYIFIILLGFALSCLFRKHIIRFRKGMFLFDAVGIALFTTLGIKTCLALSLSVPVCLIMGVVSAVFGGIIRDVLTGEIPLIFRKEIYATACFIGGMVYLSLWYFDIKDDIAILVSILVVFIIRYFSVKRGWALNLNV
jgi:uncharacterized membrane protein YeiH